MNFHTRCKIPGGVAEFFSKASLPSSTRSSPGLLFMRYIISCMRKPVCFGRVH